MTWTVSVSVGRSQSVPTQPTAQAHTYTHTVAPDGVGWCAAVSRGRPQLVPSPPRTDRKCNNGMCVCAHAPATYERMSWWEWGRGCMRSRRVISLLSSPLSGLLAIEIIDGSGGGGGRTTSGPKSTRLGPFRVSAWHQSVPVHCPLPCSAVDLAQLAPMDGSGAPPPQHTHRVTPSKSVDWSHSPRKLDASILRRTHTGEARIKDTTLCPLYILNSAKNEPILIIFGVQNPEKISHKNIANLLISPE